MSSGSAATDVGPWVEQQKQQQVFNALDLGVKKDLALDLKLPAALSIPSAANMSSENSIDLSVDSRNDDREDEGVDRPDEREPNEHLSMDDDELIPTAIVIKNIPFAIKKEQLLDVMTKLNLPLPYAFNYHFDNGVFRGLAFANFTSTEETSMVVNQLNGREIGSRKLRVEYKKMLPMKERERIEREKREKRGQLEEQHRSNSNASLASLISVTSTTAATKNHSVTGQTHPTQTERLLVQFPFRGPHIPTPPNDLNLNEPEVLELYSQLLTFRDDNLKLILELAFPSTLNLSQRKVLSLLCQFLNLLELFDNGLIIIRRKQGHQTIQQREQQSAPYNSHLQDQASSQVNNSAGSALHFHPGALHMMQLSSTNGMHGVISLHSSMMNLNQIPAFVYGNGLSISNPPELLRSQSQSALPTPRLRQQSSTPVQQLFSQYSHTGPQQQKGTQGSKYQSYNAYVGGSGIGTSAQQHASVPAPTSSSAAALLRSSTNRSFVDVRSTPTLSNTFQVSSVAGSPTPQKSGLFLHQGAYFMEQHPHMSQPATPVTGSDMSNRFTPFGQHTHLSGSMSSLQPSSATGEEFGGHEPLNSKLNSMNIGGYDKQKSTGIWGPKK